MLKTALIINKNARRNRKPGGMNKDKAFKILGKSVEIFETYTLEEVESVVSYLKTLNFDLVMGSGGDGTHHILITQLIKTYGENSTLPIYLPLRGGTMNFAINNIPVRGSQFQTLYRVKSLLEQVAHRLDIPKDLLRKNRVLKVVDGEDVKYGFAIIFGLPYRITKLYYETGEPSPKTAFQLTTSLIGGYVVGWKKAIELFEPFELDAEIDGEKYPYRTALLLVAAVFPKLVLWFEPFYKEDKWKDGYYLLVFSEHPMEAIKRIRALSKGYMRMEKSFNDLAERTVIKTNEGYGMDGELTIKNSTYTLEILKGPCMTFLRI